MHQVPNSHIIVGMTVRLGYFLVSFSFMFLISGLLFVTQAQDLGVAQPLPIVGENLLDNSIISYDSDGRYLLSTEPYDKAMFGIMTRDAAVELSFEAVPEPGIYPVVNTGTVPVRVNGQNGAIKVGDPVTSSSVPGVAMKATKTGFILGVAQNEFNPTDPEQEDLISVALDIKFAFAKDSPASEMIGTRLLEVVKLSSIAALEEPSRVFRYVVASVIMLGTLAFAFLSFARVAHNGTEALGRNPLASKQILTSMGMNIFLSFIILGSGIGTAYLLIR